MKYYQIDFVIEAPPEQIQDVCDIVSAMSGEIGFETFEETPEGVRAYIQQPFYDSSAVEELIDSLPFIDANVSFTCTEAEDRNWNEQWEKEGFEPIIIEERCHPSIIIHDGRHLPKEASGGNSCITIEIDAQLAFGTGNHATTRMMVGSLIASDVKGKRVLDCGCGTGILAIAALKLGASEAVGYDIDEWSSNNARHNAVINQVDAHFTSLLGDASVLNRVEGKFDVVMANINRNILLADMEVFREKMNISGTLLLSGFYNHDAALLIEHAGHLGLRLFSKRQEDEWVCLSFHTDAKE